MSTRDTAALAILSLSVTSPAFAQGKTAAPTPRPAIVAIMSDIEQRFICPEFLPDEAARAADLAAFAQALATIRPRPAPVQMNRVRSMLMKRHNCSPVITSKSAPAAPGPAEAGRNVAVASAAVSRSNPN